MSAARFRTDPLGVLDELFPAAGAAAWLPGRQLVVADPEAARAVLANPNGLYEDTSDFFHTRTGVFGPREAQLAVGRRYRALLGPHLVERRDELAAAVAALPTTSRWPDAGNWLLYRHLETVLLGPETPEKVRRLVEQVVERAVLAGARERRSRAGRAVFRFRVALALGTEVERRRARGAEPPADLLDAVVGAAGADVPEAELAEVFLSSLFAIAGSIGFTVGWSVYLAGRHPEEVAGAEPGWVVREALRLWPIAWFLSRRPTRVHEVAGFEVAADDSVVVCPYLVQRHPAYWSEPDRFRPERWADGAAATGPSRAWIPFGWGPHTCAAAYLSLQLAEDVLSELFSGDRQPIVVPQETRPNVGAALAPPRYELRLEPRRHPTSLAKGGERLGEAQACRHDGAVDPA